MPSRVLRLALMLVLLFPASVAAQSLSIPCQMGRISAAEATVKPKTLTDSSYTAALAAPGIHVVLFCIDGDGPSYYTTTVLTHLRFDAAALARVQFWIVNAFDNERMARAYRVSSAPLMLFLKDGKEMKRIMGTMVQSQITQELTALNP